MEKGIVYGENRQNSIEKEEKREGEYFNATQCMPLSLGARGSNVEELQHKLNQLDYDLVEDGVFERHTYLNVMHFQSKYGLITDGIAGVETVNKLNILVQENSLLINVKRAYLIPSILLLTLFFTGYFYLK